VIASGNHLLTQVKDNPGLRRKLELGSAGRKPSGSAKTETAGRNRWETRELTVFPAKAWFRHTPWENLIKTVLRLERTVCKRSPATGLCTQTNEVAFWISSASGQTPERWNEWIRAHWRIENGSHYVRDPDRMRSLLRQGRVVDDQERVRAADQLVGLIGKLPLQWSLVPDPGRHEMMELVVIARRNRFGHRADTLAIARTDQPGHIKRAHPPPRLVSKLGQEWRKPIQ
jgi:hypothetical protein